MAPPSGDVRRQAVSLGRWIGRESPGGGHPPAQRCGPRRAGVFANRAGVFADGSGVFANRSGVFANRSRARWAEG